MHMHGLAGSSAIEPAELALGIVKAHQPMHRRNLMECSLDRAMRLALSQAFDTNADQRAQPRLCALLSLLV
jgi:hypothetical protein